MVGWSYAMIGETMRRTDTGYLRREVSQVVGWSHSQQVVTDMTDETRRLTDYATT